MTVEEIRKIAKEESQKHIEKQLSPILLAVQDMTKALERLIIVISNQDSKLNHYPFNNDIEYREE